MSVWKKASKLNQRTHRERHQPSNRTHLGLLEKHKDYVKRAQDFNDKRATLKLLQKRALNKNPDEFYHHMINSKVEKGVHHDKEKESEDTAEQLQIMETQDYKYVTTKRTQELKKIERLQAQLHLTSVDHNVKNRHKRFEKTETSGVPQLLASPNIFDVDIVTLKEAVMKKKSMYKELAKRIHRERELSVVQRKLEMKRHLQSKKNVLPPKRVMRGSKESAPVYRWQYERKK